MRSSIIESGLFLSLTLALVACGDTNAVVGGACANGYVQQGSICVPSSIVDDKDGGVTQGDDGGDPSDASRHLDGSLDGALDGSQSSDGSVATDTSTSTSSLGEPPLVCVAPDIECSGQCIDPTSDPNNCGSCGKVCPSNNCVASQCVGSAPGHVIVIGHDYQVSPSLGSSQSRVLSNATFIPASNPLRVMSYEQYADATAVANAEGLVSAQAKQLGRSISFVATSSSTAVSSNIDVTTYDVLLVHDQKTAPDGTLATIGATWNSDGNIAKFLHAGGVVILLSGGLGIHQMPDLATSSQLLSITSQSTITGSLDVLAPADVIGSGVISPYIPKANTVSFATETNGGNVVWVVGQNGSPVVVHKVMP